MKTLLRGLQGLFQNDFHVLKTFCSAVLRLLAGDQVFDRRIQLPGDIGGLKTIRERLSGYPSPKGLITDVAFLRNGFLFFILTFYQIVHTFPKCNSYVFHRLYYTHEMRNNATYLLDNVLYMRIL